MPDQKAHINDKLTKDQQVPTLLNSCLWCVDIWNFLILLIDAFLTEIIGFVDGKIRFIYYWVSVHKALTWHWSEWKSIYILFMFYLFWKMSPLGKEHQNKISENLENIQLLYSVKSLMRKDIDCITTGLYSTWIYGYGLEKVVG